MKLLKTLDIMNQLKKINDIQTTDASNLIKKSLRHKIGDILNTKLDRDHAKYIATQEFNKRRKAKLLAILKHEKLATKADINYCVEKIY